MCQKQPAFVEESCPAQPPRSEIFSESSRDTDFEPQQKPLSRYNTSFAPSSLFNADTQDHISESIPPNQQAQGHSSVPMEPLESQQSPLPESTGDADVSMLPACMLGTGLTGQLQRKLLYLGELLRIPVVSQFSEHVTHIISESDEFGGAKNLTFKLMSGIVSHCWIVNTEWVEACTQAHALVSPEPYQIKGEGKLLNDGPHRSRLTRHEPGPFDGYQISLLGHVSGVTDADLTQLLELGGARVVSYEALSRLVRSGRPPPASAVLVYDSDITLPEEAERGSLGMPLARIHWVYDSIVDYRAQPLSDYTD